MSNRHKYPRDLLVRTAATATSLVDLLRRLDVPLGSGPYRYLRDRLRQYGIDTSHFDNEPLPRRKPHSYSRERLAEAAASSHNIREMLEFMGVAPYDSVYTHLRRKLDRFGIDTSHFTGWRGNTPEEAFPRDELARAVAESYSLAGVLRALGCPSGGAGRARVQRSIAVHGISTAHFVGQGHRRGQPSPTRKTAAEILRRLEPGSPRTKTAMLRRALDESGVRQACGECGTGNTWQGKLLVLEIDHINGDRLDNRLENLRFLCPSCHSQTRSFSNPRGEAQYSGRRGSVPQLAKRAPV